MPIHFPHIEHGLVFAKERRILRQPDDSFIEVDTVVMRLALPGENAKDQRPKP